MEYRVRFYETEAGDKPMVDFLESLRGRSDVLHKLATAGLLKLRNRDFHGPLGVFELRVGRTDIARVFFFFQPNREIVCTNGYVKKAQKLDPSEIARAERYKADWERRHPRKDLESS